MLWNKKQAGRQTQRRRHRWLLAGSATLVPSLALANENLDLELDQNQSFRNADGQTFWRLEQVESWEVDEATNQIEVTFDDGSQGVFQNGDWAAVADRLYLSTEFVNLVPTSLPAAGLHPMAVWAPMAALFLGSGEPVETQDGGSVTVSSSPSTPTPPVSPPVTPPVTPPANNAPTASSIDDECFKDGDTVSESYSSYFSDPDSDALSLTASGLPTGLTLSTSGALTGTVGLSNPLAAESHSITLTADDGNGGTASTSFALNVGLDVEATDLAASTSATITGSPGEDNVVLGRSIGRGSGNTVSIDLKDGANNITFGNDAGDSGGVVSYTGGTGIDKINFGTGAGKSTGKIEIDAGDGDNQADFGKSAARFDGEVSYVGGDAKDTLTFLENAARRDGSISIEAGDGENSVSFGTFAARAHGKVDFTGGTGIDQLSFGNGAAHENGNISVDLGSDGSADSVTFSGSVGNTGGTVEIFNFNRAHDTLDLPGDGTDYDFSTSAGVTTISSKASEPGGFFVDLEVTSTVAITALHIA